MSPHCVWIITVGGLDDTKTLVKFPNIVMLTESELGIYIFPVYKFGMGGREIFKKVFMWMWLYDHIKTHPFQLLPYKEIPYKWFFFEGYNFRKFRVLEKIIHRKQNFIWFTPYF